MSSSQASHNVGSQTSKELKRKLDALPDRDGQVEKRPKLSTNLEGRSTARLRDILTKDTVNRVRSALVEAYSKEFRTQGGVFEHYERWEVRSKVQQFFESFDVHSQARFDRVRAIARLHNQKLAEALQQGTSFTETQSWKQIPDYRARETPLQVIYNWHHDMKSTVRHSALRTMAEHFGLGIVVLISPIDFLK